MTYAFGRQKSLDERDLNYPLRALIPPPRLLPRLWRNWRPGAVLNQGDKGYCVGAGWAGWLAASPIRYAGLDMKTIYCWAIGHDPWSENDGDCEAGAYGTSVRAGAEFLVAQGRIASYHWAQRPEDVVDFLLSDGGGPVVTGFTWKVGMLAVDKKGFIHAQGYDIGGHCTYLYHANRLLKYVSGVNSWGTTWGRQGRFRLSFDDLALLLKEGGEACAAVQKET